MVLEPGTRVIYEDKYYIVIGNAELGKILIQNEDDAEDIHRVEEKDLEVVE